MLGFVLIRTLVVFLFQTRSFDTLFTNIEIFLGGDHYYAPTNYNGGLNYMTLAKGHIVVTMLHGLISL